MTEREKRILQNAEDLLKHVKRRDYPRAQLDANILREYLAAELRAAGEEDCDEE